MFDISFAEVMVVVTGAGFLLGRREITQGARYLGQSLGKMVGTLQGVRIKYEEKTSGTQIYALHKNVKAGLQDMGTIGSDLAALGTGRIPTKGTGHVPSMAPSTNVTNSSFPIASAAKMNSSAIINNSKQSNDSNFSTHKLAKLVLAENILNETRPVEGVRSFAVTSSGTGADLLQAALSESIVSSYYASELKKQ